ncbi:MAG: hypothetical protein K6G87_11750 [Butyrivibrio sp.]|uniref:hypothetical protein n=1 Tax=Butyrivibrio sp. TaxID=28121 RepID=UPI0025E445EA|nr:hypothetical protein [Butyrivibrio sp.]MCR5771887.1 hypothetical protein [Butyrivibrio sp.]
MRKHGIIKTVALIMGVSLTLASYGCGDISLDDSKDSAAIDEGSESDEGDYDKLIESTEPASSDKPDKIKKTDGSKKTDDDKDSEDEDDDKDSKSKDADKDSEDDTDDNKAIYEQYLNDELEFEDELFSQKYMYLIEDYEIEPCAYYYDVDEDSEPELLISTFYYGYDIYDVRDDELVLLDYGEDTTTVCIPFYDDEHTYVAHCDFTHQGRQVLDLIRYDEDGEIVESISLCAYYPDSENDYYDEDSEFIYNGDYITMEEYEEYSSMYQAVPVDDMEEVEIDMSLFG